ncbi:MAG: serine/threonine-protein kinase [Wenzhouxiangella sp.]
MSDDKTVLQPPGGPRSGQDYDKAPEHDDAEDTRIVPGPQLDEGHDSGTVLLNPEQGEATVLQPPTQSGDAEATRIADPAHSPPIAGGESADDQATRVQSAWTGPVTGGFAGEPLSELTVGSILRGRFRIESVLGEGGMGTVFSAVDLLKQEARDEQIHVALKVMKPGLADAELTFMGLQREARRAQQLAHPNIVTVYDFDRADGHIYMTMEHLRGKAVSDLLKQNRHGLDPELARDITMQVASGLAYAHAEGIVHVDLKPQNIFMLDSGRVKILDFGIAKAYQEQKSDRVEDAFSGYSPPYASPQIIRQERPTPRDDVFALGIVAYALFTGKHPFDWKAADEVEGAGIRAKSDPAFSRSQWKAIRAALNFDAEQRPADAGEFLKRFAPSRIKRAAIAVSSLSVLAAMAFVLLFQPEAGPDIPFEQLDPALQARIQSELSDATTFAELGDLDSSLQLYQDVLELHPGNLEAVRGMNQAVDMALGRISQLRQQGAMSTPGARGSMEALLAYDALPAKARDRIEDALAGL